MAEKWLGQGKGRTAVFWEFPNIGAKCDFEIWGLKVFLSFDKKNSLQNGF